MTFKIRIGNISKVPDNNIRICNRRLHIYFFIIPYNTLQLDGLYWGSGVFRLSSELPLQIPIEISPVLRDLITVIFCYSILRKPLKTLDLSQVSFPLFFPLCYIVPSVFMNSDKGKYKGKKII